jgi:hypothetical protein
MSLRLISGSAIVCSALLAYGWAKPFASESQTSCGEQPDRPNTSNQSNPATAAESQCSKPVSVPISEQLLNLQWGNWSNNQLPNQLEAEYGKQLMQAQATASRNLFPQAIATIAGIPRNSRHFETAQQLQEDWSRELLRQAASECQQAQVDKAVAILEAIPSTSQLYSQAIELQKLWKQQAVFLNRAVAAKAAGDWQGAIAAIKSLEGSSMYHSLFVQDLMQTAMIKLYEPDQTLLEIATIDVPSQEPAIAPPESISPVDIINISSG